MPEEQPELTVDQWRIAYWILRRRYRQDNLNLSMDIFKEPRGVTRGEKDGKRILDEQYSNDKGREGSS